LSISLNVDWRGRERINSSGCEACLVHFKEIKAVIEWI